MPDTEMIVMISVVAGLTLAFTQVLRLIGTAILHRTILKAIDKDPAAAETMLAQLGKPRKPTGDDRLSTILVAIGIAMIAGALVAVDDPGDVRAAIAAALFPLLLGLALWARLYILSRIRRGAGQ